MLYCRGPSLPLTILSYTAFSSTPRLSHSRASWSLISKAEPRKSIALGSSISIGYLKGRNEIHVQALSTYFSYVPWRTNAEPIVKKKSLGVRRIMKKIQECSPVSLPQSPSHRDDSSIEPCLQLFSPSLQSSSSGVFRLTCSDVCKGDVINIPLLMTHDLHRSFSHLR